MKSLGHLYASANLLRLSIVNRAKKEGGKIYAHGDLGQRTGAMPTRSSVDVSGKESASQLKANHIAKIRRRSIC